jgi:uncharacterized protein
MKKFNNHKVLPLLAIIMLVVSVVSFKPIPAYAADTSESAVTQHIYDEAGLLSSSEKEELEQKCIDSGDAAGVEIMILTHDDPNAIYAEDYIEDFEDQLPVGDRVYLLVDMSNRVVFMEGYGAAETYIHSKRIDTIIEEITPFLSEGNYYDAFSTYIDRSAGYMGDDSEINTDHDYSVGTPQNDNPNAPYYDETWPDDYGKPQNTTKSLLTNVWVQLLAAIVIGIITVSIMAAGSGGRMTAGGATYMDQNQSGLIGRRDDYIRTHVTRVPKPKDNPNNHASGGFNAGGFRGGTSAGGRSHSSGGGKF